MQLFLTLLLIVGSPFWPFDREVLPGDTLVIINKSTNELAWINDGKVQLVTKVATGKTNEMTPEGLFTVKVKAKNPYYRKANIPGGEPQNPLGTRWIGFDAFGTDGRIYGLHGTNNPFSIGKYISEGCIRLPKNQLEVLYDYIPVGTKILIVNSGQSFKSLAYEIGVM
ncbi:L,D-transpeptidase [Bacillus sp. FJAT-49732]|uniref:L,D-transpeptidase n=1 Tax=Lederbergia citrisecunda TaxID=2833583 RepID=A0A942TNV4_9BACI|nr:L,D-transpeptidase [Lederbergia citrisecunda]MBS4199599.1 L,D-transpeptidase [Lederbergia citrisecunda]